MTFFTMEEFVNKYNEFANAMIPNWYLEASCEMIFSQIGMNRRDASWNSESVPLPIKRASMEQLRFMLEHDLPLVDSDNFDVGSMKANIKSDYSTLALRILANNGFLYRGNPINSNMSLNINFGG